MGSSISEPVSRAIAGVLAVLLPWDMEILSVRELYFKFAWVSPAWHALRLDFWAA